METHCGLTLRIFVSAPVDVLHRARLPTSFRRLQGGVNLAGFPSLLPQGRYQPPI